MRHFLSFNIHRLVLVSAAMLYCELSSFAQPQLPADVGTVVNGFQDDFDGADLQANWVIAGSDVFAVSGGQLHVSPATGDPNHLLYELPAYDNTVQEVLVRVRVLSFGSGDLVR